MSVAEVAVQVVEVHRGVSVNVEKPRSPVVLRRNAGESSPAARSPVVRTRKKEEGSSDNVRQASSLKGIRSSGEQEAVQSRLEFRPNRSASISDQGGVVSFKRQGTEDENGGWSLSKKKLERMRTLHASSDSKSRAELAQSVCFGNLSLESDGKGSRSYISRRRGTTNKGRNDPSLTVEESTRLKRTLSDPQVKAALVAAEDDAVGLSNFMKDSEKSRSDKRISYTPSLASYDSKQTALLYLYRMAADMNETMPDFETLTEAFAQRDKRMQEQFNMAKVNPLHHLESGKKDKGDKAKSKDSKLPDMMKGSRNISVTVPDALLGKKTLCRPDCVLEQDEEDKYVLKYGTCERMVSSFVDKLDVAINANKKSTTKKGSSGFAVMQSVSLFCLGSLKVWSSTEVLEALIQLAENNSVHSKLKGTHWDETETNLSCLQEFVLQWMKNCFPRCVCTTESLQSFTTLISLMPQKSRMEEEMVSLSQASSAVTLGGKYKNTIKRKKAPLKRFLQKSLPSAENFLQLDILQVPAADIALELSRATLLLMRDLSPDKIARLDFTLEGRVNPMFQVPPAHALRERVVRLGRWAASNIVGEKLLKRRVELFSKMVAVAVKLVEMRNMHDASAIVSALHNPAVSRLKQTIRGAGETVALALENLTNLIRPPYKNLRKKQDQWANSTEKDSGFLPALEVLCSDITKLDEIEKNVVPHPEKEDLMLGNMWKINLIGGWVQKFLDGFTNRTFEWEGTIPCQTIFNFIKSLPDVYDDEILWLMSQRLETSVQAN